jgi:murein DD-endopeptidase MepM/ murein hydrolase activator NlpD
VSASFVDRVEAQSKRISDLIGGSGGDRSTPITALVGSPQQAGQTISQAILQGGRGFSWGGLGLPDPFEHLAGLFSAYHEAVDTATARAEALDKQNSAIVKAKGTIAQNVTPAQIEAFIAQHSADSPLKGYGAYIKQAAEARGVSVPLALALMWKESSLGTTAGPGKILTGIKPGGAFRQFNSWQDAIDATMNLLATPDYYGKSIDEQIGSWYAGPEAFKAYGRGATDAGGGGAPSPNGSVGDYVDTFVVPTFAFFGQSASGGAPPPMPSAAGVSGSLGAITGGQGSLMQDFGATGYAAENPGVYAYETQMGMEPGQHTGLDIGVARGTRLYTPVGGEVIFAGPESPGVCYYKDGDACEAGKGELRIRLDNGDELILGHMSSIGVRPGQRVAAGDWAGFSGGSDGDHVHVEYRIRDSGTPSGWRIVDPRTRLGQQAAAPARPSYYGGGGSSERNQ